MTTIAFIGGGNMARAMIGGLLNAGTPAASIRVADPSAEQRAAAQALGAVTTEADNITAVTGADVVVLSVKPQILKRAANGLRGAIGPALVVSVAAGIRVAEISAWLGDHARVVRAMPNTPTLVGRGAAGLYARPEVGAADRKVASSVLDAAGDIVWVDEEQQLDAVTAISGSGPAYFFLMLEALEDAALELGLPAAAAKTLARATAAGAAEMAIRSDVGLAELRRRVTSPGGTTEAAIRTLVENHFDDALREAARAAFNRSIELSNLHRSD